MDKRGRPPALDRLQPRIRTAQTLKTVWRVAVPVPLFTLFDYLPVRDWSSDPPAPGTRLRVPFGRHSRVAYLIALADESDVDPVRLKRVSTVLDDVPLLRAADLALLKWVARYYHHPLGEVMATALPSLLRQGQPAEAGIVPGLALTAPGRLAALDTLSRAPRQALLLRTLQETKEGVLWDPALSVSLPNWRRFAGPLIAKGLVERASAPAAAPLAPNGPDPLSVDTAIDARLNPAQRAAVNAAAASFGRHTTFLLEGVTGSGKTEVYLNLARLAIARGEQVLLLLPEISLTPQLERRFHAALPVGIAMFHSRLTELERLRSWLAVQRGAASVLLGTRSAVFVPMKRLGLIIIDEEHDAAYKQQDGLRFSARDVAIKRARDLGIPILLGSATPSLETLWNVARQRYHALRLPERAGGATAPSFQLVDIRQQRLSDGLSGRLIDAMQTTLQRQQQVLLFINRRGFAPTLTCHHCGWVAGCVQCDARLVIHQRERRLRCHHCAHEQALPKTCPACGAPDLRPLGSGTERVEDGLQRLFPAARILRIDRDTTAKAGSLKQKLSGVHAGEVDILIGTQMLAKGHHFPRVTLVGILDADAMMFATDFRASERSAQMIVQVAGRAGRGDQAGTVMLQTRNPDHPLLRTLIDTGYTGFAAAALSERRSAGLPPFGYLAVCRADALNESAPLQFLMALREQAEQLNPGRIEVLGPAPAPMLRRAGRHRYQLLLQSARRAGLHALLDALQPHLPDLARARKVRWSIDIDPIDCY